MVGQILRFGGVGVMATVVHVVVALLMHEAVGLAPVPANFAGFTGALLLSYLGHAHYTFGVGSGQGGQFLRFLFVALFGLATSTGTVWVLDTRLGVDFAVAMAVVAVLVPLVTYLALRFWVFAQTPEAGATDWAGIALSGAIAALVLATYWGRMINHDTAWYLIAVREWLGDAGLYIDIIEVNPPINFYFTLPAIWLADLLGISDTNGQYLALALLMFGVLCWSNAIIREGFGLSPARRALFLAGIGVALVLPALNIFAQREHVMVILTLPWLLGEMSSVRAQPKSMVARAAVAALGVCLKPHFLVFPMAVTLVAIWRRRSLRPVVSVANLTFLAVGLGYICLVALAHPAYFTHVVPVAREIYGAYGTSFDVVFNRVRFEIVVLLLPTVVVLSRRPRHIGAGLFPAMALAGLAAYFLQGRGFNYHAFPFVSFSLLACFLLILRTPRLDPAAIAAAATASVLVAVNVWVGFYHNPAARQIADMAQKVGRVDSLIVLSSTVFAGPISALAIDARWASRYPSNWLVPGALNRLAATDCGVEPETCARLEAIGAQNRSDNLADISAHHPDLLVMDLDPGFFDSTDFSWEAFMAQDPAWPALFGDYEKVGVSERFIYYRYAPKP